MSTSEWSPYFAVKISPQHHAYLTQQHILEALAADAPFNERALLTAFSDLVLARIEINPKLQLLVNAVVAKAVLFEKLPDKPDGAPKGSGRKVDPEEFAADYLDGVDSGKAPTEALAELAVEYEIDERTARRLLDEAGPWMPGGTTDMEEKSVKARMQARKEGESLGLRWDYRNEAYRKSRKANSDEKAKFAGLDLPAAKSAIETLLSQAVQEVKARS